MSEIRAFIAVPPSAANLTTIADLRQRLSKHYPNVRWVRDNQIHLTLRFFAALTEEDLDRIHKSMLSIGDFHPSFTVAIQGLGGFPRLDRPRVLWLGLEPATPLVALYRRLENALCQQGVAAETRPFHPHVTIGRARRDDNSRPKPPSWARDWHGGTLQVTEMVLFQSRLTPDGAVHTPLHRVQLRGTAPETLAHS